MHTSPGKPNLSELVSRLADEMIARWHGGEHPPAEEYFDRHPELWLHPDAALELIAEELALREEHGRSITVNELAGRFPRWQQQVETLWHCQKVLPCKPDTRALSVGDELGGFRLVIELGRGANGRVFLATQAALGGRTVVLKLAPNVGREHLSLARLQHSNIVPLYSAHEFPDRGLRGLCLPYFGRSTLATLMNALADVSAKARTGEVIFAALCEAEKQSSFPLPVSGPACNLLQRVSYVEATCRIAVCLAEALDYAHNRGLVHLDIKPSNVLLAADGVPMLLDFHLARSPLHAGEAPPAWLGGTPEYMAPELAAAVAAVRNNAEISADVDGRADVYSLGVLLSEVLGIRDNPDRSHVPTGVLDILSRCTAPNAADRYPNAAELATDLRSHLADLPLRGVANRSLAERWAKWRRRHPFALTGIFVSAAILIGAAGFGLHAARQVERASSALREGESLAHQGRYAESLELLRGAEARLECVPFSASLAPQLHDTRQKVERAQTAAELHRFCERVRLLYAAEVIAPTGLREAEKQCRDMWAQRKQIAARLDGQPTAELDRQWRADLLDLGILTAHLHVRIASQGSEAFAHRTAMTILKEAESLLGPSGVLYRERAVHAEAIGWHTRAAEALRRAAEFPPQTAWEHLVIGRALLAVGDLQEAAKEFARCLELDPGSLWGNNYRGVCLLRMSDPVRAASAFSACVALSPNSSWCFSNRGLAYLEAGRLDAARADFDRAIAIDEGCAAALLGRSILLYRVGRSAEALSDLRRARGAGLAPATIHYHTAVVQLAMGSRSEAIASLRECLACDPNHSEARTALARLEAED